MMSFWTFSDVFDESGPGRGALRGRLRPDRHGRHPASRVNVAFALLHRLGERAVSTNAAADILVTRRADGTLAIAAWNLVDPDHRGASKTLRLRFRGVALQAAVSRPHSRRPTWQHAHHFYRALGSPPYPTAARLRASTAAPSLACSRAGSITGRSRSSCRPMLSP